MVLALDTSALEKVSITGNKLFSRNFDHGYQIQCNSNIRSNKRFWGSNLLQPRAKFFFRNYWSQRSKSSAIKSDIMIPPKTKCKCPNMCNMPVHVLKLFLLRNLLQLINRLEAQRCSNHQIQSCEVSW